MDGRKNNKGKKKDADKKKVAIVIYRSVGEITNMGGMDRARTFLNNAFDLKLLSNN